MSELENMVCGFMFHPSFESMVLIRKRRPEWQRGFLNGVGGHVEPGESDEQAMAREFSEETGIQTSPSAWTKFYNLSGDAWSVSFLASVGEIHNVQSKTDESVNVVSTREINPSISEVIPNLRWLIPMAIDRLQNPNTPQTDARTDLLERIKSLEGEVVRWRACVSDDCETEKQAKEIARKVLTELEVYGDSYCVPNVAGIVETLAGKLNSLQGELSVCRSQSLQMQQEMEELRHIIEQCLDTGAIRVDEHKQLFLDANRVLGRTPQ